MKKAAVIIVFMLCLSLTFQVFAEDLSDELVSEETEMTEEIMATEETDEVQEESAPSEGSEEETEESKPVEGSEEESADSVPDEEKTEETVASEESVTPEETVTEETVAAETEISEETESTETTEVNSEEAASDEENVELLESVIASGDCGDHLTWVLNSSGSLVLTGSGEMYDYGYTDENRVPWWENRASIKTIVLPEGLTVIGANAFANLPCVTQINIPKTVTKLCDFALFSLMRITSITLPANLTYIGKYALGGLLKVTEITIPESVTFIDDYAFYNCNILTKINIPANAVIGANLFKSCSSLKSVGPAGSGCNIEYGWTETIPENAFANSSVETAIIGDGIKKVGDKAFQFCPLKKVTISASVEQMCYSEKGSATAGVFSNCTSLYSAGPIGSGADIEYGWTEKIPDYAFAVSQIEEITIPRGLKTIGKSAFWACHNLREIKLPKGVAAIQDSAFTSCENLQKVYLPTTITTIGSHAFKSCTGLTDVYYNGTKSSRTKINIGHENDSLEDAAWHYQWEDEDSITSITLEKSADVGLKKTYALKATVDPADVASQVVWTSSDKNVATVDENGIVTGCRRGTAVITASSPNGKITASCKVTVMFHDIIDLSSAFKTAINWLADNGIANGNSDGSFGQINGCTRKQFAIFIWRSAGKPEVSGNMPFADCQGYESSTDTFKAIIWAANKGIVKGYPNGNFGPNDTVTRKQAMIMLYRYAGKPSVSGITGFSDVDGKFAKTSDTYKAILWGTNKGITNGYSDGRFGTNDLCIRRQIALFLYRYLNN